MTFVFDQMSGLLFFLSFAFALWISASRLEGGKYVKPTDCPLHPHTDTCAHRRKK